MNTAPKNPVRGEAHPSSKHPSALIKKIRTAYEIDLLPIWKIRELFAPHVKYDTVKAWCYYKTRNEPEATPDA